VVVEGSSLRYTPVETPGLVSMPYTISDGHGHSASAIVTVQVVPRATAAPHATDDAISLPVGTTAPLDPLANDTGADGTRAGLTIRQLGTPLPPGGVSAAVVGGVVQITAGRTAGHFTIPYVIADAEGLTANGTIDVTVTAGVNQAPVANPDLGTAQAGTSRTYNVLANDTDPDGGTLRLDGVGPVSPATAGSASTSGSSISVTAAIGSSGTVTIPYTIRDDQNATASSTLTLTVSACPTLPVLTLKPFATPFETPITLSLGIDLVALLSKVTYGTPSVGTAVADALGAVTYTPPDDFNGTATVPYTVRTVCGDQASGTLSIQVNRPPQAPDLTARTSRSAAVTIHVVGVAGGATDADGDQLKVTAIGTPSMGTAKIVDGKDVVFTPDSTSTGSTTFTYTVSDVGGLTSIGSITVDLFNTPPKVENDDKTIPTGTVPPPWNVLQNDSDVDPGDTLSIVGPLQVSPASAGTASFDGPNITFTPAAGLGPTTVVVTYAVSDGLASTAATLTIKVTNQPPTAGADHETVALANGSSVTFTDVLDNDTDPDGPHDGLRVTSATVAPTAGTATPTADGLGIVFTSAVGGPATVIINYVVTDADGGTASSTVTVDITAAAPPP
jgi:hypothetical protein